jgi:AcrR family transcriptional regulator
MEAATREFADLGYARASLRAIASRAGVTTPVLYDHFESKRALHLALLEQHASDLRAHQGRERDVPVGAPLARALFEDFFAWVRENPYAWRMLFRDAPSDRDVASALREAQRRSTEQIAAFVAMAPQLRTPAGLGRPQVEQLVAEAVYGVLNGLVAWWWDNPEIEPSALAAVAHDLAWNGLGAMTGLGPGA